MLAASKWWSGSSARLERLAEANGNAPDDKTSRIPVKSAQRPDLALDCEFLRGVDQSNPRSWMVDAGKQIQIRCQLQNRGLGPASNAQVTATITGGRAKTSAKKTVAGQKVGQFDVQNQVPSNAKTDERLRLELVALETNFGETKKVVFEVTVGMMKICTPPISRTDYDARLEKLRRQRDQRLISKEQFEAYEGQLVGCLE